MRTGTYLAAALLSAAGLAHAGEHLVPGGSFKDGFHNQSGIIGQVGNYFTAYLVSGTAQFYHEYTESLDGDSQGVSRADPFHVGIYTIVDVNFEGEYQAVAAAATTFNGASHDTYDIGQRFGIDPYGGTDPSSPGIIWTDWFWQNNIWHGHQIDFVALSPTITMFFEIWAPYQRWTNTAWIDRFALVYTNELKITGGPWVSEIGPHSAKITWTTNYSSGSLVRYGTTADWGMEQTGTGGVNHTVYLSDLQPATTYHYSVKSTRTGWVSVASVDDTFTTEGRRSFSPGGWLKEGWNLISIPLAPYDPAVDAVLDGCIAAGSDPVNNLFSYTPGAGYSIYPGDFTGMSAGAGYWLHLAAPADEDVVGEEPSDPEAVALGEGWNLIGNPQDGDVVWADCQVDDGTGAVSLQDAISAGWLDAVAYYYDGAYFTLRADGSGDDDSLRPWRGYWVLSHRPDLTLLVPRP